MNQRVEFLTDGGDTVRELPRYLCPESEHWLDWFHITMRITVLGQHGQGPALLLTRAVREVAAELQRLKWFLWHGNVFRSLHTIDDLRWISKANDEDEDQDKDEDAGGQQDKCQQDRLAKAVREFGG